MKLLPVLIALPLIIGFASTAGAAKKKHHDAVSADRSANKDAEAGKSSPTTKDGEDGKSSTGEGSDPAPASQQTGEEKPPLDFDFFGDKSGAAAVAGGGLSAEDARLAEQAHTRRWMLKTHQTLGIATWLALLATVTVGQLNYNELYGGGGGSNKWQTPHRALVISTSALFAATATFALLAPTPYKKPLRLDTGLVHRVAVIGATLGMLTEGVLGWITTHQADAGNPHNLRTMARTHQIVGYTTLGFLTIAGTVWVF
jgi:hypothetical protein